MTEREATNESTCDFDLAADYYRLRTTKLNYERAVAAADNRKRGNRDAFASEYNRLVELSTRKTTTPEAAPLPFVLTRASFKLRVKNKMLLGTVNIDGTSLLKGPVKAPLVSGLTVLKADQPQCVAVCSRTSHTAILNGPGPFGVSLGVASALTIEAGRASFMLPVPAAGSSLLSLELPGNHANVHVEPGIVTSRNTANGNTLIEGIARAG